MNKNYATIDNLLAATEGEHVQFKEAKKRFDSVEAARICCALANRGGGRLVLGITDKRPRQAVGSNAFDQPERTRNWYEYVEYGTTNPLTILLQRNGFSRETAMYIRQHRNDYVVGLDIADPKLKRSLAQCGNFSVELEVADMLYNNPVLFV